MWSSFSTPRYLSKRNGNFVPQKYWCTMLTEALFVLTSN